MQSLLYFSVSQHGDFDTLTVTDMLLKPSSSFLFFIFLSSVYIYCYKIICMAFLFLIISYQIIICQLNVSEHEKVNFSSIPSHTPPLLHELYFPPPDHDFNHFHLFADNKI